MLSEIAQWPHPLSHPRPHPTRQSSGVTGSPHIGHWTRSTGSPPGASPSWPQWSQT